jgi:hypothetical protein
MALDLDFGRAPAIVVVDCGSKWAKLGIGPRPDKLCARFPCFLDKEAGGFSLTQF